MKLRKYILSGLLGLMIFSGCTNLDETPYTFVDPSQFYQDEDQLNEALNAVYNAFRSMASAASNIMRLEGCTDFGQPNRSNKNNIHQMNRWADVNSGNNSGTFTDVWAKAYVIINRANTVITRTEASDLDNTTKQQVIGQARFLRGQAYYWLVRLFGGVPISEKVTESLEGLEIPRNTAEEVWNFIIADWEYAEANLPVRGASSYDIWRVSKGAAQAYLGELYLYRACMAGTKYGTYDKSLMQKSAEYSKKVIDAGTYQLLSDYTQLWYSVNPTGAKNNAESIFELQFNLVSGQKNNMHLNFGTFGDSYYPSGWVMHGSSEMTSIAGSYMYLRIAPSVQAWESYADNDDRLKMFITKGAAKKGGKVTEMEFVASDLGKIPGSKGWNSCAPGNAKFYDFTDAAATALMSANNFMLMRYSEVLLNYAEALNTINPGSSEALKYLNMVHQRAGLSALSITDGTALDDAIFQERGWEFIGECKLYYDELRTDRLGPRVYEFVNKYNAMGYSWFQPLEFVPQKTFLWKIPASDLNSNSALEQNPDNVSYPGYSL